MITSWQGGWTTTTGAGQLATTGGQYALGATTTWGGRTVKNGIGGGGKGSPKLNEMPA